MSRRDREQGDGILEVLVGASGEEYSTIGDYVRLWWMQDLGPTATALLQVLATGGLAEVVRWPMRDLAFRLGVGYKAGPDSTLNRAIDRLERFDIAAWTDDDVLVIPSALPRLGPKRVAKLPPGLRAEHDEWTSTQ